MKYLRATFWATLAVILIGGSVSAGIDLPKNQFDEESLHLKYQFSSAVTSETGYVETVLASTQDDDFASDANFKKKSPLKAFLLSLAVPGLGQFYYGSKIKPIPFVGTEVAAWVLYFKFHGEGDDATDVYEAYNHAHWSRSDYEDVYLQNAYGTNDDDNISATEISHHLPDEETQQYFEMTGKYDQFAWGWDDASLESKTLDDWGTGVPPITGPSFTPVSAHRQIYEGLRDDANSKYQRATNMIILSIVNHVVSSFEAYITTKRINNRSSHSDSFLSNVKVKPSFISVNEAFDTPYVKLAYKFK